VLGPSLDTIFERFIGLPIVIVGDVMLDAYWFGSTTRISPEAPVPIVHVSRTEQRLGGAANVALNLKALGATPLLCSVIGKDEAGNAIKNLLQQAGIATTGLLEVGDRPTTVKTRIISQNQHMLRVDAEITDPIPDAISVQLLQKVVQAMPRSNALIFEDYDKGCLTSSLIADITKQANAIDLLTVVDPKKRNFLAYEKVDVFKPNLKELREGLKIDLATLDSQSLFEAHTRLQNSLHHKATVVTLSEHGIFAAQDSNGQISPAHVRQISDVSGAGDTVVAVLTAALAAGAGLQWAAKLANLAGGLVCEQVGVVPISRQLLLKEAQLSYVD